MLLWIGSFRRDLIVGFKRTKKYRPEHFDLLKALLRPVSQLVVTPHILTEVNSLAGHLPEDVCEGFRRALVQTIRGSVEQEVAATKLVAQDWYPRLGIADAALTELARNGRLIITDDLPLYVHLAEHRWPVLNFTHVLRAVFDWR
ncbi:MAG: hypothetical protein KGS61_06565 [Verrucomicrobia bacterium]|nr:hypothetical protein [Verrucomicrobiota bacterium]